jgi:hypothetical protein
MSLSLNFLTNSVFGVKFRLLDWMRNCFLFIFYNFYVFTGGNSGIAECGQINAIQGFDQKIH